MVPAGIADQEINCRFAHVCYFCVCTQQISEWKRVRTFSKNAVLEKVISGTRHNVCAVPKRAAYFLAIYKEFVLLQIN